jgi:hypothetical protein
VSLIQYETLFYSLLPIYDYKLQLDKKNKEKDGLTGFASISKPLSNKFETTISLIKSIAVLII